jgi:hypothetical protein
MLCDKYKEALTEAAASGTALPRSLLAHLGACAACHAFLATQQALFTFVDNGLRSRANVAMPSKFDHRIRAALQIQVSPARRGQSWAFAFGSIAVAAAVLLAILLTQNLKQDQRAMPTSSAIKSKFVPAEQHPAVVSGDTKSLGPSSPGTPYSRKSALMSQRPKTPVLGKAEVEVLVPRGQEELLVKYMEGIAARRSRVTFSANLQHEPYMKPAEISSIEISQGVVRPLPDLSSD